MKATRNLKNNQELDQICKKQQHTRKMRCNITYIDPEMNEIPHNLAIPPQQWPCLFSPVPNTLTLKRDSIAMTCNWQVRLLIRNKGKIQVLPYHSGIILLPRIYPNNLNGKIPKIVLRMWSKEAISSSLGNGSWSSCYAAPTKKKVVLLTDLKSKK